MNHDVTNNPPIGVARLVTAPLIVMAAVPVPEPLALVPRTTSDSGCYECDGEDCQCEHDEGHGVQTAADAKGVEPGDTEMVTISQQSDTNQRDHITVLRKRSDTVMSML